LDYENFLDEILKISSKIRYAGIYDEGKFHHKTQKEVKSYLTEEETETNLSQVVYRWSTRKKMGSKIGKPIFSMTKYEKVYRLTFPLNGAGLILVSIELELDPLDIVDKVLELKT